MYHIELFFAVFLNICVVLTNPSSCLDDCPVPMKTGKQLNKSKTGAQTEQKTNRAGAPVGNSPVSAGYWNDLIAKQQNPTFLEDDNAVLPPISKIRDGLYIGSFEASISTDVCYLAQ